MPSGEWDPDDGTSVSDELPTPLWLLGGIPGRAVRDLNRCTNPVNPKVSGSVKPVGTRRCVLASEFGHSKSFWRHVCFSLPASGVPTRRDQSLPTRGDPRVGCDICLQNAYLRRETAPCADVLLQLPDQYWQGALQGKLLGRVSRVEPISS